MTVNRYLLRGENATGMAVLLELFEALKGRPTTPEERAELTAKVGLSRVWPTMTVRPGRVRSRTGVSIPG
jgi:hypothetical protein